MLQNKLCKSVALNRADNYTALMEGGIGVGRFYKAKLEKKWDVSSGVHYLSFLFSPHIEANLSQVLSGSRVQDRGLN